MAGTVESAVDRIRAVLPWTRRRRGRDPEGHRTEGGVVREVVFGANDGLVSNVALVAGVAGGTTDAQVILLSGVAGLVAGAISMALGAYISTKSEREYRETEEEREHWEVENMREQEIAETRQIFRLMGITGPLLDEVVAVVSRDHDRWVQLMMTKELGFPEEAPRPRLAATVMGLSFAVAAFFPVAPYVLLESSAAFVTSLSLTGVALFGVGLWRAHISGGAALRKAVEMVVLAAIAVGVANGIGRLVGVSIS